jgi:hypothetical protein
MGIIHRPSQRLCGALSTRARSLSLSLPPFPPCSNRHPPGPTASDLRGQAARGWPHPGGLQHPEGVHPAPRAPPARRHHRALPRAPRAQDQRGQDDLPQVSVLSTFETPRFSRRNYKLLTHDTRVVSRGCLATGGPARSRGWVKKPFFSCLSFFFI